jgi:hypothetical protein
MGGVSTKSLSGTLATALAPRRPVQLKSKLRFLEIDRFRCHKTRLVR